MTSNVSFDDAVYTTALNNMSDATVSFQENLAGLREELLLFVDCTTKFDMSGMLDSFANVTSMGSTVKTALAGVSDAVSVYKTFKDGTEAVNKLTDGFASMKGALSLTGIAYGAQMSITNLATAAQTLLNGAIMLFPAAMIIAAVAAVVAGITLFVKEVAKGSENFQAFNARMEEAKKKTDEACTGF